MAEITREQFENMVVAKASHDPDFRLGLLNDAKRALAAAFGNLVPAELKVQVVEEPADTLVLVLPDLAGLAGNGEMSDAQLAMVAGGISTSTGTCGSSNCTAACLGTTGTVSLSSGWRTGITFKGL
jgi:hypothetical protein